MSTEPGAVSLDLVPVSLIAPRLEKIAAGAIVVGIAVGVLVGVLSSATAGVVVALAVAVPISLAVWKTLRRHISLSGNHIRAGGGLRTTVIDVSTVVTAELTVRSSRFSEVAVVLGDGRSQVRIPLALYANGGGRELEILALRTLADALATSELVPAAALSSILIEQLRAEARGAGLSERPLHQAVELVRAAGRVPKATLTDQEVASLLD